MPGKSNPSHPIFNIHFNIVLPSNLGFQNGLFCLHCVTLVCIQIVCPANFLSSDLTTVKMSDEENKLRSSTLCNFLHLPVTSTSRHSGQKFVLKYR
jgi:hypothetical protein